MSDESHWSTRYYRVQCPDLRITFKIDGPDGRADPEEGATQPCILGEHLVGHPLVRISPDEYARLTADDDDDRMDDDDDRMWNGGRDDLDGGRMV